MTQQFKLQCENYLTGFMNDYMLVILIVITTVNNVSHCLHSTEPPVTQCHKIFSQFSIFFFTMLIWGDPI